MRRKKILSCVLLTAVVAFFALGPFAFKFAHAWNLNVLPSAKDIILGMFAEIGNLLLHMSSIVLYFTGMIFDYAVQISILDFSKYANMPGIMDGWRIVRDVVNLSFIFILLYIAIGTILQLTGFDTKKLLTSVIVIALLVNFSAVLTKVVIDASNVLALEFYQKIDQPSINGQKSSLAGVFVSGLKLSTVYKPYDKKNATGPKPVKDQFSYFGIILGTLGGVLVILITSFVLLAAAVLFIYRTIALLFLIVLSPLAFVAMAFPGMQSHAAKWRGQLFSQAFFAPAFLFMLYLVAKMITSQKGLASVVGLGPTDGILGALGGGSIKVMVYFVILIGFLVGSLTVAKSMGANGAVMVEGWGKKLKGKAQGYAGGVSKRYVGRAASKANEALMATEGTRGRIAGVLRKVPFAQRGVAGLAQIKGKEIGKYKKKYSNYDKQTLEQLRGKFGTTPEARTAMDTLIEKKKKEDDKKEEKKDNIKKESDRLKVIEKELRKAEMVVPGGSKTVEETYEAELLSNKSRLMALQGNPSEEAHKNRAELLIKERKIEKKIKNIENLRKEKVVINEKQEKRKETEGMEERLSEAEKGLKEVGDKKPSGGDSPKT